MSIDEPWSDDILKEKSLWEVYRASRVIDPNNFNKKSMRYAAAIAILYVVGNAIFGVDNADVTAAITKASGTLITVTTAILGFLVTGFSIFVAATPREVFRHLELTRYRKTNISHFKQVMFNFLNVFTVFLFAMTISIAVYIVTPLGSVSPVQPYLRRFSSAVPVFNSLVLSLECLLSLYCVLRLKSFIWSLYQSIIVSLKLSEHSEAK